MAMFACFLANNTLTACPDAFDDYVQHLMAIESRGTDRHSRATVAWFEQLLHNYRQTKLAIMNKQPDGAIITVVNVNACESGVGKSTFINAFVNYLSFESLDAANGQPICLIPVSFSLTDPKTQTPVRVVLGDQDMNENSDDTTKSATQYPKCYKFEDDNIVLNIIDTPGIADTDGIDQDNRNMQNILDFISNYKEINAFCILLKPNEARLDVLFKYCLFQLFTQLNKSAANNILFLFTNSRSTDYMPGDSGPALLSILDQIRENPPNVDISYNRNTVYCFDSESFRYLVASVPPNNIQFEPRLKSTYIESWDRSVNECQRLLNHIIQLPAHKVMDTLSLNNAKQMIQLLTKPLADITKNIADNVMQCELHKLGVKRQTRITPKLHIPTVELLYLPLAQPKTVCGHDQCCNTTVINHISKPNYHTPCHSPCYLHYNDGNILGNRALRLCKAFNKYNTKDHDPNKSKVKLGLAGEVFSKITRSNTCRACGHSYQDHLNITYELQEVLREVPDNNTCVKSIALTESDAPEREIQRLDQRIAELSAESETIINSMALFACFLANNTLTACPDAFDDYVRHLMSSQPYGTDRHSRAIIAWFEQFLHNYRHAKLAIVNNMPYGVVITVERVAQVVRNLSMMKHNGHLFCNILSHERQTKVKYHVIHNEIDYKNQTHRRFSLATFLAKLNHRLST
ncbi:unnamed protein product [Medioppia subpectinata]|uniref:DUF8206 domain-containing protein n=1 Tax=Medioppia subpectinata TaxID=1979941 RepID=A0A7R9L4L3_9ACAR|nr:unnamed protein product [Medioppia subpectinata]CAG2115450.1 unnamed protein product [Medioppia subpectinata]